MNNSPAQLTDRPPGWLISACTAGPPSPEKPVPPLPAIVVIIPVSRDLTHTAIAAVGDIQIAVAIYGGRGRTRQLGLGRKPSIAGVTDAADTRDAGQRAVRREPENRVEVGAGEMNVSLFIRCYACGRFEVTLPSMRWRRR
jgi:hypothetical protein